MSIVVGGTVLPSTAASAATERDRSVAIQPPESTQTLAAQAVADSIGRLGQGPDRAVFSGIKIDSKANQVIVYATDPVRAEAMVGRGIAALPAQLRSAASVQIRVSKYSRVQMEQAAAHIWASAKQHKGTGVEVYSIVLPSDGRGLQVRTNAPERAGILNGAAAAVGPVAASHVEFIAGHPVSPVSREDPDPPFPGGIPIRWDWWLSGWSCTAAFGVRNPSNGKEYLLTAEHCYDVGDGIEDMDGEQVGWVRSENNRNDGALIETDSQSGVWVNDDYVFNVRTSQYSWDGEMVCQSGYTSYPNRCQIVVTNEYLQWDFGDGKGIRVGVEGHRCQGCPAVAHGDSGGPVWSTYTGTGGGLVARGIVSGGHHEVQAGVSYEFILWTEVPPATAALGVSIQTS